MGLLRTPDSFLPLSPADFQLLLILLEGDAHAYGIAKSAEGSEPERGRVPLEIGSLYRILSRLAEWGLIDDQGTEPSPGGPRRKVYRITKLGRDVAAGEATRLRAILAVADARLRNAEG